MTFIASVDQVLIDADALVSPLASRQLERCLTREADVYISAASLVRLGRRCARGGTGLEAWMRWILDRYPQAVLPVDGETAWLTGELLARHGGSSGRAQQAASAWLYDLTVVTLTPAEYERYGCRTVGCATP